jgi:hypothetical protein
MLLNENADFYDRATSTYIVAYIDLLGVASRIASDSEKQKVSMNKLHNLYTFSIDLTRQIQIKGNQDIQFKIFSDNIIIAKKLSTKNNERLEDINCLLSCASHFQELAASDSVGWMLRGGITIGQLFIDEVMVWGDALVKAYFLEDKVSVYPRIIVDSCVVDEVKGDNVLYEYLRKDFDGLFFLNYLNNCHFCGQMLMDGFELMQKEIGFIHNKKMRQKFSWHMNYINSELDRKNERKDKNYRLTFSI